MKDTKEIIVNSGFTIIETLFVLAIAGIFLLIVFDAIPTLSRSTRNNQRKQDVSIILEAVSHYELNDSGEYPAHCGQTAANACSKVTNGNDNFLQFKLHDLTYYTSGTSTGTEVILDSPVDSCPQIGGISLPCSMGPTSNIDEVEIWNYERCDPSPSDVGGATPQGAGFNDIVALYALEGGSGTAVPQCRQL
jgi:prepilin-type N-terminal cleavage/methylation domain-containing protein